MSTRNCASPYCKAPFAEPDLTWKECPRCRVLAYCSANCKVGDKAHKTVCTPDNYVLRVQLLPREIVNPPVERTLSCPATATFYQLHQAMQIAFGWASSHLFDYTAKTDSHKLRVFDPDDEHADFPDYDMADFMAEDRARRGLPPARPTRTKEKRASAYYRLWKHFEDEKYQDVTLMYEYDFGDGWEHHITVVDRAPATKKFTCVSGTGHGVAEDVGGSKGWQDLKEAYLTPTDRLTPDQRDRRRWYEREAMNGDPRGLGGDRVDFFDLARCNQILRNVRVAK
ncbi:Protein MM3350-like domain containing protein [Naviculisporaceae sp. PSN 640]